MDNDLSTQLQTCRFAFIRTAYKSFQNSTDRVRSFLNGDSHVQVNGVSPMEAWDNGGKDRKAAVDILIQKFEGMHL